MWFGSPLGVSFSFCESAVGGKTWTITRVSVAENNLMLVQACGIIRLVHVEQSAETGIVVGFDFSVFFRLLTGKNHIVPFSCDGESQHSPGSFLLSATFTSVAFRAENLQIRFDCLAIFDDGDDVVDVQSDTVWHVFAAVLASVVVPFSYLFSQFRRH